MTGKFKKHIVIVGSARSGTSWLSETMAQQKRYRMLFEPEHDTRTKYGTLICDQWFLLDNNYKAAGIYLKRVFQNRVDCDWIAQHSNRKFKRHLWPFLPKKYIIKFVRCNLLAPYINEKFNIPVIHVIRNPYEVVFSQKRANFSWLTDFSRFASQQHLVSLLLEKYSINLNDLGHFSKLELLTLRWCIENALPIELLGESFKSRVTVVRYEELIDDIEVFKSLCKTFNIEPIKNIEMIYKRPSSKTHHNSTIKTKQVKKINFTITEFGQIKGVLDIFQTNLYSRSFNCYLRMN